jgi:hypothetical protein
MPSDRRGLDGPAAGTKRPAVNSPFNINPSLWILLNSMWDVRVAGAVAVATAAKKKQEE